MIRTRKCVFGQFHQSVQDAVTACMVQGDLSLMADKGQAGLPLGHVIAYKADHEMHIEFARKLKASCGPADVVPADKA